MHSINFRPATSSLKTLAPVYLSSVNAVSSFNAVAAAEASPLVPQLAHTAENRIEIANTHDSIGE